jgi:HAD superfamily hydrolase (TIGR01509 family)
MKSTTIDVECLIFDFDGTLVRSEGAYREAFHHSIRHHTGHALDETEFKDFWNATPLEVLRRYSEDVVDQMLVTFEEHYYANHQNHLAAYDGVAELLDRVVGLGVQVAIVSLKPRRAGERELDFTGIRHRIASSVWGDDVANPKPDPSGVLLALANVGVEPSRALVVGDSPADIIMGRRAGTRTAAALWGGADRQRLLVESPDIEVDLPGDLLRYLTA